MKFELRPHRDNYDLNTPFEIYVTRQEFLQALHQNREHCWLELSTLVRMLALSGHAECDWDASTLDDIIMMLELEPGLPGLTLSVLPRSLRRPVVVFDCVDAPLPCIVAGYDAVIERLRATRDPFWQESGVE